MAETNASAGTSAIANTRNSPIDRVFGRIVTYLREGDLDLAFRYDPIRAYAKLRGAISRLNSASGKQVLNVPGDYDELLAIALTTSRPAVRC